MSFHRYDTVDGGYTRERLMYRRPGNNVLANERKRIELGILWGAMRSLTLGRVYFMVVCYLCGWSGTLISIGYFLVFATFSRFIKFKCLFRVPGICVFSA